VLAQTFAADDFEVIVVNDSGKPLPEADWQQSRRVRLISTNRRERCFARNAGAAIARGRYLHFLDDDDWITAGTLERFWELANRAPRAAWLYGASRFVTPTGELYGELKHDFNGNCFAQLVAGVWIPLPASLISTKSFFEVGGFYPFFLSTEDLHLARCIALHGDFAGMDFTVTHILRGGEWASTSDYDNAPDYVRQGRDNTLSEPGAFTRMQKSATSSFWHGRIFHAYLTSLILNLRQRKLFSAMSRAMFAMISLIVAGPHIISSDFWRAIRTHHVARDFH